MDKSFRLFNKLEELSKDQQERFKGFSHLNNEINKNASTTYQDLYNAYVKIILDTGEKGDISMYSEIDFQVKALLDDIGVPVNTIIDFAGCKFGDTYDVLTQMSCKYLNMPVGGMERLKKNLYKIVKGHIVVFYKGDEDNKNSYFIPIDMSPGYITNIIMLEEHMKKASKLQENFGDIEGMRIQGIKKPK